MSDKTNQTSRVLELLKRFNDGKLVCIDDLQNDSSSQWYEKSEKTIRRDLDVIKEYFPDSFELVRGIAGKKGCYRAITRSTFENFLKPDALSLLVQTFNIAQRSDMFDNFEMSSEEKRVLDSKIKEVNKYYEFKNKPFETKKDDHKIFKKIENSIHFQKYIIIEYPNRVGEFEKIEVQPYKIVFINENFYMACARDHEEYEFSMYRISKIKSIEDTSKTYQKNPDIEDFIVRQIQTPFSVYRQDFRKYLIDIVLEVDKGKAYFFRAKEFLKTQKIEQTLPNGNLIISYKVTQELEIEDLIKRWLPYIKVLEPLSLQQKIVSELKSYITQNEEN